MWAALLSKFGIRLDQQYFSYAFDQVQAAITSEESGAKEEAEFWIDFGVQNSADRRFSHFIMSALRIKDPESPTKWIKWCHANGFDGLDEFDVLQWGDSLKEATQEQRDCITKLWGTVFPPADELKTHYLDCTCEICRNLAIKKWKEGGKDAREPWFLKEERAQRLEDEYWNMHDYDDDSDA